MICVILSGIGGGSVSMANLNREDELLGDGKKNVSELAGVLDELCFLLLSRI
jgi:hypothetical protein